MALIAIQDLVKVYSQGKPNEYTALKGISLTINQGEFVSVMGVSGSGKSTLMNIIGCLDTPTSGEYRLEEEPINEKTGSELVRIRRNKIGFIFQNFNLLPRLTTLANVELPLIYCGFRPKERHQRATAALTSVGLGNKLKRKPTMLSGGEQQRVAIARALVNSPSVILADEPTGNLDSASGNKVMEVLTDLNTKGATVITVTHDKAVADFAKRKVLIQDGKLAA